MANEVMGFPAEQLVELGRAYHRLQQEHQREAPRSATRRRLRRDMDELDQRFERLVTGWVSDEDLRERWRLHFYQGEPPPGEPRFAAAALFKGKTEANALIELRAAADGGYDIFLDRKLVRHETVPWHLDPDTIEPVLIDERYCTEVFDAPDQAVAALEAFLKHSGTEPPWQWGRALIEDGLIDADFALTPRGQRRVARAALPEVKTATPRRSNFCVIVANAARARILTLESPAGEHEPTRAHLVEVADLSNPEQRARDSELFSDTRPGLRREGGHGPRHGVSDRRNSHRDETSRRFAEKIIEEAAQIWRAYHTCRVLVVASPAMLGFMRPVIADQTKGQNPYDIRELGRDLTRMAPAALHDALAEAVLLPPRARLRHPGPPRPA